MLVPLSGGSQASAQAPAHSMAAPSGPVVALWQSSYITEQENFSVSMQVASTAGITFVYFAFCQLSSPVCYQPIVMAPHPANWYNGTTNRMSSYPGMTEGVRAGYNITITYANNSTLREPAFPNTFTNLTIAQEVGGENMFEMTVSPQLYGLSGVVDDSTTGLALAGATVTLSPGSVTPATTSATGAFSFSGLLNGTYSLSVSHGGYLTENQTVVIAGQDVVKDLSVSNASGGSKPSGGGGGTSSFLPGGASTWALIALLMVVIVVAVGVLVLRKRKSGAPPSAGSPEGTSAPTTDKRT